jgi:hypothetical protein
MWFITSIFQTHRYPEKEAKFQEIMKSESMRFKEIFHVDISGRVFERRDVQNTCTIQDYGVYSRGDSDISDCGDRKANSRQDSSRIDEEGENDLAGVWSNTSLYGYVLDFAV